MSDSAIDDAINKLVALIMNSKNTVVFTGAGISTESGIPDFRGPKGLWTKYDPDEFTIQRFLSSIEHRKKQWRIFAEGGLTKKTEPNAAHHAIAELERIGKLDCVITQNVDNLHQKAGNSPERVFELHGNMQRVKCLGCGKLVPMENILKRLEVEEIPDCDVCRGILKPDVILFGESLPQITLDEATQHARKSDLFIVIGSTLTVYPAAYLPMYALENHAKLAIINMGSTPFDSHAIVRINGKAGEIMSEVIREIRKEFEKA